jgi:hypothetical protein
MRLVGTEPPAPVEPLAPAALPPLPAMVPPVPAMVPPLPEAPPTPMVPAAPPAPPLPVAGFTHSSEKQTRPGLQVWLP